MLVMFWGRPLTREDRLPLNLSVLSDIRTTAPILFDNFPNFDIELPDDLLASISLPETTSTTNVDNTCTNAVFTNCSINVVVNK